MAGEKYGEKGMMIPAFPSSSCAETNWTKRQDNRLAELLWNLGVSGGIRTRVTAVKGTRGNSRRLSLFR
jgi:hypothetical protein